MVPVAPIITGVTFIIIIIIIIVIVIVYGNSVLAAAVYYFMYLSFILRFNLHQYR
jgi:hypothetical protein